MVCAKVWFLFCKNEIIGSMVFLYLFLCEKILNALSDKSNSCSSIKKKISSRPDLVKMDNMISKPKSAWMDSIPKVFRKPLMYEVAGYGVFSWVKGGVIKRNFNVIN